MARGAPKSGPPIQKLLDEREQIVTWLERLALAADKTPEHVRVKVKADYEKRLNELVAELQSHRKDIEDSLERHRKTQEGLTKQEKSTSERLAESELRYAVGELDEAAWRKSNAEILETLVRLREELKASGDEVTRLEAVLTSFDGPPEPKPEPKPEPPKAAASPRQKDEKAAEKEKKKGEDMQLPEPAAPRVSRMTEFIADPDPMVPTVAQQQEPLSADDAPVKPKQTDAFDELAFIKSVSEDEEQGPQAARASGMMPMPDQPIKPDPSLTAEPPKPKAEAKPAKGDKGAARAETGPRQVAGTPEATPLAKQTGKQQKSLKCSECGTMNAPTEWYCERCGAELMGV